MSTGKAGEIIEPTTVIKKVKTPPRSSKINIQDATIIDEKKNDAKTNKETVDSSYVNNLQDQQTVNLGDVKNKKEDTKVVIDFMNQEHINQFTAAETKKVEDKKTESSFEGKSVEDLKADIKKAEEDSTKNFTAKDFEDIARFIIFLIDTGISSGLKWWSGDTSDVAYSLAEKKKETLVYQLTLILVKYQAKFSIEFMFLLSIIFLYAGSFVKAKAKKKEIKEMKLAATTEDLTFNEQAQNFNAEEIYKKAQENGIVANTPGPKKPIRKRGNPGKA